MKSLLHACLAVSVFCFSMAAEVRAETSSTTGSKVTVGPLDKFTTLVEDATGGGGGSVETAPPPPPPPNPELGGSKSALNLALFQRAQGGQSQNYTNTLTNGGKFVTSSNLLSPVGIRAFDGPFGGLMTLANPFTAFLSAPRMRGRNLPFGAPPQAYFSCNNSSQLLWIPDAATQLPPDPVGWCSTVDGCKTNGQAIYEASFANDIWVGASGSCPVVMVAGAGYHAYNNGAEQIRTKTSYVWRSAGEPQTSSEMVRFLNRNVGCEDEDLSLSDGQTCDSYMCGGLPCEWWSKTDSEATRISANGLNVVGDVFDNQSGNLSQSWPNPSAPAHGLIWRSPYIYPVNRRFDSAMFGTGPTTSVPYDGLSDSFVLQHVSADWENPDSTSASFYSAPEGLIPDADGGATIVGTSRAPGNMFPSGARWQIAATGNARVLRSMSDIASVRSASATARRGDGVLRAVGSTDTGTRGAVLSLPNTSQALGAPLVQPQGIGTNIGTLSYASPKALTSDSNYAVGQLYNSPNRTVFFGDGGSDGGAGYDGGFFVGIPAAWDTANPSTPAVIRPPQGFETQGGIAWDVANYGSSQLLVVGTFAPSVTTELPKAFISVCNRDTSGLCCSRAEFLDNYLRSKGIVVPENADFYTANAIKVLNSNVVYITGTARFDRNNPNAPMQAFAVRVGYAAQCTPRSCTP